jgi:hypothetical protein
MMIDEVRQSTLGCLDLYGSKELGGPHLGA